MAPVTVDPDKVHEFADAGAFYARLGKHHDTEDEVWIKIHKVGSGLKSVTPAEAIDVVLGWIDATGHGKRIAAFVEMLKRGETIHPQGRK